MENENTKISKITIGRLHNLGSYEHIRYEISVELGADDNPASVLLNLEQVLQDLQAKSGYSSYGIQKAKAVLAKNASELDKWEVENLELYKSRIAKHDEAMKRREAARQALTDLGGSSIYKDAKLDWEGDEDY